MEPATAALRLSTVPGQGMVTRWLSARSRARSGLEAGAFVADEQSDRSGGEVGGVRSVDRRCADALADGGEELDAAA